MRSGFVGLGRMGLNMRDRLSEKGYRAIGFDPQSAASDVPSLEALVASLAGPRTVWVMVPASAATHSVIVRLAEILEPGDLVVDGGNSRCTDDHVHADFLAERGIKYVDCGVSGGIWGRHEGYALMAGGAHADIARLMPIFDALRPDRDRRDSFVHAGPTGAGHYAKMVHNGIEYGLMQAYAEGYELLTAEDSITDVNAVLRAWSNGTVVRSWLLNLLVNAVTDDPGLTAITGYTEDSGEGRWTVEEAIAHSVPAPVISAARFASRQTTSPTMKAVAALRNQFGGHTAQKAAMNGTTPQ
ncbi:NADP(+)-dependent, decarboxylating phosphogluconate dehydrogenase [Nocardia australiensis]|uniref:NADP(+)-dependent, decarboxylating phosphogluconate dehydrogenase n=1 Tax=Nocardia australiensis TaxID=2887191 RepID=UPI001D147D07|nr:decarboxylating 6-phosphogluconate dehydrogenase [Nocardia australiensis]